ncbi:MAG: hypothetical protein CVV63_04170, partial [Tenericutes bacterium HGW-Tenericutes-8]
TYAFIGFTPTVGAATGNQTYTATYQETLIDTQIPFNPSDLNDIFGFNIYTLIPTFETYDYVIVDFSDATFFEVYVDMFDWTESDVDAFIDLLDVQLTYDDLEESWILGDYYIYAYEDVETYEGLTVYGFGIYGDVSGEIVTDAFDSAELNAIFEFDIYSLMPSFTSDDAIILDYSDETYYEVYIDMFDWTETNALAYMDLLDDLLVYDDNEESWILGDLYVYVYADDETYDGLIVYGIGIYGESDSSIVTPDENLYYTFNVQNTTTSLTTSYKENVDQILTFSDSSGKVVVKSSYLAQITGTPPGGLSVGVIFAANVSGVANPSVYLEIDTLGQIIQTMTFEIEARDAFSEKLLGAVLQVYNGYSWVDLAGGNFYSELSTDQVLITINNINASKFRLLFTGSGITSNGGQFKISAVSLYASTASSIETWSDAVILLEGFLNETALSELIPTFENLTDITLNKISTNHYQVSAGLTSADNTLVVDAY